MAIKGPFPSSLPEISMLLFDLDGTLVRMRPQGVEFRFMARAIWRFSRAIYPWRFRRAFWEAAHRMQNHGTQKTNYEMFLETLARYSRRPISELDGLVRTSVERDFSTLSDRFEPIPGARETVLLARELGYQVVIATNPVFPLAAVKMRMEWGGIGNIPFDYISHSEVMTRCKPDPAYYRELLDRLHARPEECVMIGNDWRKDLPAKEVGIRTFIVESPGVSSDLTDPRLDGRGTFEDLQNWLKRSREERWAHVQSLSA